MKPIWDVFKLGFRAMPYIALIGFSTEYIIRVFFPDVAHLTPYKDWADLWIMIGVWLMLSWSVIRFLDLQ